MAATASTAVISRRRSIRVVSHDTIGDAKHRTTAPQAISSPASRIVTFSPSASCGSMPDGAKTTTPVMKFPLSIAKRAK